MERCTIQLVRVPKDDQPREINSIGQLWWVTPATEVAVKELMIGEDVTKQQCADCGFRGTKKESQDPLSATLLQVHLPV